MKRAVSTVLVLIMALLAISGCSSGPQVAKIGLGHVTSIAKSKSLSVAEDGTVTPPVGQADTVIAAVAFDKDGKVLKVEIDTAQVRVNYDENLQLTSDLDAHLKTKVELKDDYGMARVSTIKKEWYQQIDELEKWMVGKTVEEIKGMKVKQRDASHPAVPDVPELTSLVTITVQDYIAAVEEAYNNAVEVTKGVTKLGLGHEISIAKSRGYSKAEDGTETAPQAQADVIIAATAFDKDGKVVKTIIDTAQTRIAFDTKGTVTSDLNSEPQTKKELGDKYGMGPISSIGKNWHEQAAELEKWMAGKTVAEIKGMKVKARDAAHPAVPDVPELTSLVTITVHEYIAAVEESYTNAQDIAPAK